MGCSPNRVFFRVMVRKTFPAPTPMHRQKGALPDIFRDAERFRIGLDDHLCS
jgi:hypothetical protein